MAWERRRNGRLYYYRARSVNGRVVKEYIGRGPVAEKAAAEDAVQRAEREAKVEAERRRREEFKAARASLVDLCDQCDVLMKGALIHAGYHQHKREWRRRRAKKNRS